MNQLAKIRLEMEAYAVASNEMEPTDQSQTGVSGVGSALQLKALIDETNGLSEAFVKLKEGEIFVRDQVSSLILTFSTSSLVVTKNRFICRLPSTISCIL